MADKACNIKGNNIETLKNEEKILIFIAGVWNPFPLKCLNALISEESKYTTTPDTTNTTPKGGIYNDSPHSLLKGYCSAIFHNPNLSSLGKKVSILHTATRTAAENPPSQPSH